MQKIKYLQKKYWLQSKNYYAGIRKNPKNNYINNKKSREVLCLIVGWHFVFFYSIF